MGSDLVRTQLNKSLQIKSLADLVRVKTSEDVWLILDGSGSMDYLMRNGRKRIDGLRDVVQGIKKDRHVKLISFNSVEGARTTDHVPQPMGGTPLHEAFELARRLNAGRVICISDGAPDSTTRAMDAAKMFGGKVDVVFVGDPGDYGEHFMRQLAESTGGVEFHGDLSEPKQLEVKILGLLEPPVEEDDDDE